MRPMGRQRPRLQHSTRWADGRGKHPEGLAHSGAEGWPGLQSMDPPGASAQFRFPDVKCRRPVGGHRPPGRSQEHHGDRAGLSQAAETRND